MAEKTIDTIENDDSQKKSLLLHSCCGPCSTAVLERLEAFRVRILYYNPNITDPKEYALRLSEQKRFLKESEEAGRPHVELTEGGYDPQVFFEFVKGLEQEPEGGARCRKCFELRLRETARMASELGFDCFDTTMSVSPYKNYDVICQLGRELEKEYGVEFLAGNYKKKDGYHRSILLSKEYVLYRQDYCGCVYSRLEAEAKRRERESRQ